MDSLFPLILFGGLLVTGFIFGGIATVGITGTLNALATLGVGLNIYYANSGKNWKYQRWEYSPSNSGLTITVRLELGVFAGLGFKGVASVTVNGYGFTSDLRSHR